MRILHEQETALPRLTRLRLETEAARVDSVTVDTRAPFVKYPG